MSVWLVFYSQRPERSLHSAKHIRDAYIGRFTVFDTFNPADGRRACVHLLEVYFIRLDPIFTYCETKVTWGWGGIYIGFPGTYRRPAYPRSTHRTFCPYVLLVLIYTQGILERSKTQSPAAGLSPGPKASKGKPSCLSFFPKATVPS